MAETVQTVVDEIRARLTAATPGPWIPGRPDMQSFDAGTGEAFTNVYADNPQGRVHLGEPLPYVIARVKDESGRNKADAELIAFAPSDLEFLLNQLSTVPAQIAAARAEEREACALVAEKVVSVSLDSTQGPGSVDERKALLQLTALFPTYPAATGLSHLMGLVIRDAVRGRKEDV